VTLAPVCTFGTRTDQIPHDCAGCRREAARLRAEFKAGVRAGRWNREGYTPAEWRRRLATPRDSLRAVYVLGVGVGASGPGTGRSGGLRSGRSPGSP